MYILLVFLQVLLNMKLKNLQQNFSITPNILLIMNPGWFMCILHVLLKMEISLETVFAFFAYTYYFIHQNCNETFLILQMSC